MLPERIVSAMKKNTMKAKLKMGEPVFGFTVGGNWPEIVEALGILGCDYVWIDGQHGVLSLPDIANLVRAAECFDVTPCARVPWTNRETILSYLDLGVQGIIVPDVRTKEQAEKIVHWSKFAPEGMRGLGYGHYAEYHILRPFAEVYAQANEETAIILQCESKEGLENLAEIVKVPGVDCIMMGPMDLSQSLGIIGQFDNPIHQDAMAKAKAICKAAGMPIGEIGWNGDHARDCIAEGVQFINYGAIDLMIYGLRDYMKKAKGET
jgi:4-hydroxy-2-oxoheptanedioate aldolase